MGFFLFLQILSGSNHSSIQHLNISNIQHSSPWTGTCQTHWFYETIEHQYSDINGSHLTGQLPNELESTGGCLILTYSVPGGTLHLVLQRNSETSWVDIMNDGKIKNILSWGVNTIEIVFFKSKLHVWICGLMRRGKGLEIVTGETSMFLWKLQKTNSLISFIQHI